jgi:hypothetical protein
LHEDVEAAKGLQAVGAVGDDPRARREVSDAGDAKRLAAAIPEAAIDAVENGGDLGLVLRRKQAPLLFCPSSNRSFPVLELV